MLTSVEEAALIINLQHEFCGRRHQLDEATQSIDFDHYPAIAIEAIARDRRTRVEKIVRHPRYIDPMSEIVVLLEMYQDAYAEQVRDLVNATPNSSGSEGEIYFKGHNGRSVAIKRFSGRRTGNFLSQMLALLNAKDLKGTPTIRAASMQQGVIVADTIQGVPLSNYGSNDPTPFHDGHIHDYLDRAFLMTERRIDLDPNPANYLLNREHIGIVDFDSRDLKRIQTSESLTARMSQSITPLYRRESSGFQGDIDSRILQAVNETRITNRVLRILDRCFPMHLDLFRAAYQTSGKHSLFNLRRFRSIAKTALEHKHLLKFAGEAISQIEIAESMLT